MPGPAKRGVWFHCRRLFRWCRITVLLLVLAAVCALIYLNQAGLPKFIQEPLVAELRARGVDLQFGHLRLHWYRGIVARNIAWGDPSRPGQSRLTIQEAEVRLDFAALRHLRFSPRSLIVRNGRLAVPLNVVGEPPQNLEVADITTTVRFLPNDQWELDQFQASALGARINLLGTLTNASLVRSWRFELATNQPSGAWRTYLRRLQQTTEQLRFAQPPMLRLNLRGDASNPSSFGGMLTLNLVGAETPWGSLENGLLSCLLSPPQATNQLAQAEVKLMVDQFRSPSNLLSHGQFTGGFGFAWTNPVPTNFAFRLDCARLQTPWATGDNVKLAVRLAAPTQAQRAELATAGLSLSLPNQIDADLDLNAAKVRTAHGSANHCAFQGRITCLTTNWIPRSIDGRFEVAGVHTPIGDIGSAEFALQMARLPPAEVLRPDDAWGWWAGRAPYRLTWEGRFAEVRATNAFVDKLSVAGQWQAPRLRLQKLHAELYGGQLDASAGLAVDTRRLDARLEFDFDLKPLTPLLGARAEEWLSHCTWGTPPRAEVTANVLLPAWTNRAPDWQGEVLPTLVMDGHFTMGPGSYRTVQMDAVQTHFACSNSMWRLPDLALRRPEGPLDLDLTYDSATRKYRIGLRGQILPHALKPLLGASAGKALDLFEFREPASVKGELCGPFDDGGEPWAAGELALTNFTFRGQHCDDLRATVQYTNQFARILDVQLQREGRAIRAPLVGFDFREKKITLTNVRCNLDPMIVATCIGQNEAETIAPYRFLDPPEALVNGELLLGHLVLPRLQFELDGGPFNYWRFNLPQVRATVNWVPGLVTISNLQASFYQGQMSGDGRFDVTPRHATLLNFQVNVTNADLRLLMRDLATKTNQLEGKLDLGLVVTSALSTNWDSWQGHGRANLTDGLIWDIPVFGIFSPVLNAVAPGLGNSRADRGKATFTITNSVIRTEDLEIKAAMTHLYYRGTVDFHERVNARAEAALLQDAGPIGPIFRLAFLPLTKLFEVKVSGTLDQPKRDMLYLFPRVIMMPLHPFRMLKELFPQEEPKNKPAPPATGATVPPRP